MWRSSSAVVTLPMPPGTGVQAAMAAASGATSPRSVPSGSAVAPASSTICPGRTHSGVMSPGAPAAAMELPDGTIVTGRIAGTPVRILKNQMARTYVSKERAGATMMELEQYTLGSLRRAVFDGDTKTGSLMAGQVAGMLHEIKPLRQIFEELSAGCDRRLAELRG